MQKKEEKKRYFIESPLTLFQIGSRSEESVGILPQGQNKERLPKRRFN